MVFKVFMKHLFCVTTLFLFSFVPVLWADSAGDTAVSLDKREFVNWHCRLGFDERFRVEYRQDFDFNKAAKDNGNLFFNRFRFHLEAMLEDEYLTKWAQVFVEGLDAQTGAYRLKAISNQTDELGLHQAYVRVFNIVVSGLDFKAGRQEMKYGAGRLVAAPTWQNIIRAFDAAVLHYSHRGFYGDFFYGRRVKTSAHGFDYSYPTETLSGAYFGYSKHAAAPLWEWYYLGLLNTQGRNDVHRYTIGARLKTVIASGISVDIELPYQFGRDGGKDVHAYAFHVDIAKSFDSLLWKPKFALSYDLASGDRKANNGTDNTFIPVYQSTHEPYGIMDFFRWENLRNPEISLTFYPSEKFRFKPQADFFWLDSVNDAWYNTSGSVVRKKTAGDRRSYVGSEVSLRFYYDFSKNVAWEAGCARFFSCAYVRDTGAANNADWVYMQCIIKY